MTRWILGLLMCSACGSYGDDEAPELADAPADDAVELGPEFDDAAAADRTVVSMEWRHGPMDSGTYLTWSDGLVTEVTPEIENAASNPGSSPMLGQVRQALLTSTVTDNEDLTVCDNGINSFLGDFLQAVGHIGSISGTTNILANGVGSCSGSTDARARTSNDGGTCDFSCGGQCPGSNTCVFGISTCTIRNGQRTTCFLNLYSNNIRAWADSWSPAPPPNGELRHAIARKVWLHELGHALGLDHSGSDTTTSSVMPTFAFPYWGDTIGADQEALINVFQYSATEMSELDTGVVSGPER